MKKLLMISLVAMAFASCSTPSYTYTVSTTRHADEVRTVDPADAYVRVNPMEADLQICKEGKVNETYTFTAQETSAIGSIEGLQLRAAFLTQKKYNADIIIGALFSVTINPNGSSTVEVSGYPANYINWRPCQNCGAQNASNPVVR